AGSDRTGADDAGWLWIAGVQVALGYLADPLSTGGRLLELPYGQRAVRTHQRVARRASGIVPLTRQDRASAGTPAATELVPVATLDIQPHERPGAPATGDRKARGHPAP
ncbi:hypothetical protein ACFQ1S_18100, partial [Kibdelosporangium lantanae]